MKWDKEKHNHLIELVQQHGTQWKYIAKMMTEKYGETFTGEQLRSRWRMNKNSTDVEAPRYRETIEIGADGSHKSDRLLRMSAEQSKDVDYLLDAHGYDKAKWTLVNARNNIWNVYSKDDGVQTLYSSKITVKPRVNDFNLKEFAEKVKEAEPINLNIPKYKVKEKRLLEIPLFDQHFGVSDYLYYQPTQAKINHLITSRVWEEILFIVGSDMFHNDNFSGTTTKGTIIQKVDMEQAWEDARMFYEPLIEKALKQSVKVKVMYSPGNHDETFSWAFVKYLRARFPQCEFDDKLTEHKIHVFGRSAIGITHGDKGGQKGRNEMHNVFMAQFPNEWGNAETKEIHMGHFHAEDSKDKFGTMVRTLATRNKTDEWHKRMGYIGAHKRFMLFEYTTEALEAIHYA